MKYFKTYEAYRRGVNGVGSLKNSLAALKRQNITGRYTDAETLAKGIRNEYEAITGEKYEDEVQMSMDDAIADIVSHFKLDGPEFMAAWDKVIKESVVTEGKMPDKYIGNDEIVFLKTKEDSNGAHYNLYYKGHDIDVGGRRFGNEKQLKDFADDYILSNQLYNKLKYKDAKPLPESYEGNVSDFTYDIGLAIDNLGISPKALKSVKKKGKGYEVRMSSYMSDKNTWDRIGTDIGAELVSFKPGSINIGIYE